MQATEDQPSSLDYPELVIGIAGPIGVDMDLIARSLESGLADVGYTSEPVKLTKEMERFPITDEKLKAEATQWTGGDTFKTYMQKMSQANALRKQYEDGAVLARIAIDAIRLLRSAKTGSENVFRAKHAFIIRQLKRPEEVALLRKVYGRQFILVSAYAPESMRRDQLRGRLTREVSTQMKPIDITYQADQLIDRDASEEDEALGQQLRETFHRADVFIHGLVKSEMDRTIKRFVAALFGKNDITPSKDEYGMYAAKSASLRSSDLSRQVGAALFSCDGELITQGCNEVPKAFGGTYWDLEEPDNRDIKKGHDPNELHKKEVVRDVIERLRKGGFLAPELLAFGTDAQIVEQLIARKKSPEVDGILASSKIMDLTEYGRVVHAEMLAICDAARLGRTIKGTTLYCTTFPCHNCTKHLLAGGVRRVVYMEPYPKSRAKDLHPDEIEIEAESDTKVSFVPFMGISPFRYRDIFQKGRRKRRDGTAQDWFDDVKKPLIEVVLPSYIDNEKWALAPLLGSVKPVGSVSPAASA